MTIEQLRVLHQARPFTPFTIHLADGRHVCVAHNEMLSHSQSGRTIVVYEGESLNIIDLLLVTRLQVSANGARPRRSRR